MTKETDEEILRQRREIEKLCEEARENAFYCADLLHENKRLEARIEDLEKMIAVHRLAVDVDALKARIAELEAALKHMHEGHDAICKYVSELEAALIPFAAIADDSTANLADNYMYSDCYPMSAFRAARAALEKKK